MEFAHNFLNKKIWKIRAFDYDQYVILMLNSSQLGQHQILEPNLPKNLWITKPLKK